MYKYLNKYLQVVEVALPSNRIMESLKGEIRYSSLYLIFF